MEITPELHISYAIGIGIYASGSWIVTENGRLWLTVVDETEGQVKREYELVPLTEDGVTYLTMDSAFGGEDEMAETLYWTAAGLNRALLSGDAVNSEILMPEG